MQKRNETAARFDFVGDDLLRESLESDYRELCVGMKGKAWKSVHVLAGSIIEALLIEWLQSNGVKKHGGKDLLKMDLGDAVDACKAHNLITQRAEQLTTVVRGYRNLIHPGRLIRTKEPVDQSGAEVAKALVEMITKDIAKTKAEKYGYTAEQLVNKIVADTESASFLSHLLKDTKENEKERLLLKLIPESHLNLTLDPRLDEGSSDEMDQIGGALVNLSRCFRLVFKQSGDDTKGKAVAKYVALVKGAADFEREAYEEAFFVASDMQYCSRADTELILDHLLSRLKSGKPVLRMYEGIGAYLTVENFHRFFEPLLKLVITPPKRFPVDVRDFLLEELHNNCPLEVRPAVIEWIRSYRDRIGATNGSVADRIKSILDPDGFPG